MGQNGLQNLIKIIYFSSRNWGVTPCILDARTQPSPSLAVLAEGQGLLDARLDRPWPVQTRLTRYVPPRVRIHQARSRPDRVRIHGGPICTGR